MRYLSFNDLTIDTHNQLLTRADETMTLAPKVFDLLMYFCQHPQRIISKDELMEQVWAGTLVTDNAISRTLVKVRKALGDDPKEPNYIITVPRKGYRMVVDFVPTEEPFQTNLAIPSTNTENTPIGIKVDKEHSKPNVEDTLKSWLHHPFNIIALGFFVILFFSLLYVKFNTSNISVITTKSLSPLTRELDIEEHPNLSPNSSYLAYTKTVPGKASYINIENLTDHSKISVTHPKAKLSRPVWSPDGKQLAFLYQHNQVCTIYLANMNSIKNKDQWQTISDCSQDSWPHFVFSPTSKYFYFNDRLSSTNGYQIFRVNLSNMQKDIVNQPITSGQGNYSFDISPNGQQLVMLNSEFSPQTRIYTLNIENAKLTQTAELNYLMRSVIWHHDDQTLVHPSPHPAYEIWQSTLSGEKLGVVASNTSRVKQISRINNGQDFSFVSYLLNRDIYYQTNPLINNGSPSMPLALDNSSVMDYLPTLANNNAQYAFVSKRSTTAEVYLSALPNLTNLAADNIMPSKRLTYFNNPVKLYHLAFSPEDKQLAILADNQVFLVNLQNDQVALLPLDNIAISGLSWKDEQTLLFSTVRNNNWYFSSYNITNDKLVTIGNGNLAGVFSPFNGHFYVIDDNNQQVMKLQSAKATPVATDLYCSNVFSNRQLNLKVSGSSISCPSSQHNGEVITFSLKQPDQLTPSWFSSFIRGDFDSDEHQVIYTKMTQAVSDIMKTSSQL